MLDSYCLYFNHIGEFVKAVLINIFMLTVGHMTVLCERGCSCRQIHRQLSANSPQLYRAF